MAVANVLVSTDWLADHLTDPSIAVVEVDEDTSAYLSGHIPGAVGLDWKEELHDLPRRDFVSSEQLAALLGGKGISSGQTIILYGGNKNWFATYAYWLGKLRGIERLQVLDGGRMKWELEDRPLTSEIIISSPARYRRSWLRSLRCAPRPTLASGPEPAGTVRRRGGSGAP